MDDDQTKKNHNPIDFDGTEEPGRQDGPAMNEAGGDSGATRQDDWCDGDMLYAGAGQEDGDEAGHGWETEFPCGDLANLPFKAGDELTGTVMVVDDRAEKAWVRVGEGVHGVLGIDDVSWHGVESMSEELQEDEELQVKVLEIDAANGVLSLGVKQLEADPWDDMAKKFTAGSIVRATVVGFQDYGAFVEIEEGFTGLIPVTELDWHQRNVDPAHYLQLGEEVEVMVLGLDKARQRIRLGLKQCVPNPWQHEIAEVDFANLPFAEGDVLTGTVGGFNDHPGQVAYIQLGEGIHGVLRREDYSWIRSSHLTDRLQEGEEIQVKVLHIDAAKRLIALGVKQLMNETWQDFVKSLPLGSTAKATVVGIHEHEAFAELEDGSVGLLPASELDWLRRDADPFEHLEAGQEIEVRILRLCEHKRQAILGLKHCMPNPWEEEIAGTDFENLPFKEGDVLTGTVGAVNDYPKQEARIRIGEGVHGTLGRDDYSWHRFGHLSQTIREGEELQVKVLEIDAAKRLIRLGVKQLTEDTWDEIASACPAGTKVFAKVVSVKEGGAFVEIGKGVNGLLRSSELDYLSRSVAPAELLEPGQHIEVMVLEMDKDTRSIALGLKQCQPNRSWDEMKEAFENQNMVEGVVNKRVKGGYVVEVGDMLAFLPESLADVFPLTSEPSLVGSREKFYVERLEAVRRAVILNRKLVRERGFVSGDLTNLSFKEGDALAGMVVAISKKKAYIRIADGVHGVLHREDFSWHRTGQMSKALSVGEELQVKVLEIDVEGQSIRLGVKQLSSDPWDDMEKRFPLGAKISAKVVSLQEYGAFADIGEGIEGLVHVSEMDWLRRYVDPTEYLEPGQRVEVMMLSLDKAARRISLGLKQCQPNPWEELSASFKEGLRLQGKVAGKHKGMGLFVELPGGIKGLAQLSNLSHVDSKGFRALSKHKVGDEIEVMVLEVNAAKQHIELGVKQCQPNPWDELGGTLKKGARLQGKVVSRHKDIGLFVELPGGFNGLAHLSNLSHRDLAGRTALSSYKVGDEVEVMVLRVNAAKQRIELGIRQLDEGLLDAYRVKRARRELVTGVVKEILESHAVVRLSDGIEAVLPIKKGRQERIDRISEAIKEGEELQFVVKRINKRGLITVTLRPLDWQIERAAIKDPEGEARAELEAKSASAGSFSSVLPRP